MNNSAIIVSMTEARVIGYGNIIPWYYPEDLKRFKKLTYGKIVIMGRNTWESLDSKPLSGRRNIVITSKNLDVEHYKNIEDALNNINDFAWFIGGVGIYEEAMKFCDYIDVTYIPWVIVHPDMKIFPEIPLKEWKISAINNIGSKHNNLINVQYKRRIL